MIHTQTMKAANESHDSGRTRTPDPILSVTGLSKYYPGVVALDGVDLHLQAGSAHALIGENGAGKSTLIKILAGAQRPNAGRLTMHGRQITLPTPLHARRAGIAVVHQHSHLVPELTIAENFALRQGYPRSSFGTIAWRQLAHEATRAVHVMLPGMDVERLAKFLSGVEKQMVEISFALAANPAVLILDEPTAILPYAETDRLFRMVRSYLAGDGAVIYVSHRLDEVFALCDRVTVLRDGKRVWTKPTSETDNDDLIRAMVGRGVSFERDATLLPGTDTLLKIEQFNDAAAAFSGTNLQLRAGEITGIYGLVGAGQSELCAALLGLRPATGSVALRTGDADQFTPLHSAAGGKRVRSGLALVPAERLERGMFHQMSVGENMSIASLRDKSILGLVQSGRENRDNLDSIRELRVKTTGPHQKALQLSGGNQQKVLLARWLQTSPRVLILEEPSQGVDVGAKVEIHRLIREQARKGVAILLVSSEIPELLALSHRIGIMRQGELVTELDGATASEEEILKLALPPQENLLPEEMSDTRRAATTDAVHARPGALARLLRQRELGLGLLLAAIVIAATLFVPNFATWENFRDILRDQSTLLLGALGVGVVIIAGGIDISIGAIMGLSALAAAKAALAGLPVAGIVLAPLVTGLLIGLLNGIITVLGRVHSIVVTLGMMFILQGVMLEIMDNRWLNNLPAALVGIGRGMAGPVPYLIIYAAVALLITRHLLKSTVMGRRIYALGGDRPSAELLGIRPLRVLPFAFAFSGLMVGMAGLMHASYYGQVQTTVGRGFELKCIAAAVIGGIHIMGGRGSAMGILLGALLIGVISNLLVFLHISAFWDNAITGAVILLAVCTDALTSRRKGAHA